MRVAVTSVMLASSLCFTARAQSFTDLGSFKSPSGNIFCIATRDNFSGETTVSLSCELVEISAKLPAKPSNCELDWGKRFYVEARGKALRACHGDTIVNPNYPTLAYGQRWRIGGFGCEITSARLRCVNLERHGFELSKARQILF